MPTRRKSSSPSGAVATTTTPRTIDLAPGLSMPLDAATETFGIFAVKGRGKSFTSAVFSEQLLEAGVPVVILDPTGVHWGLRSSADGKSPGFPITIIGGDHADVPLEKTAGKLLAELVADKRVPLLIDTSHLSKSAMREFMTDFMETLYLRNRRPLHLIADECDMYVPQRTFAGIERLLGAMEDVVRRGRTRGLGITLISQRPAAVHTSVRSQVSTLILLGMTGTHDIKAVDEWVQLHADPETAKQVKASLPSLPIGEAWVWSPQWLGILERVKIARRTTFDSSATPRVGGSLIPPAEWAPVDAAALSAEIAATAERAAENDPKRLRAEIRRLRDQIALLEANRPEPVEVEVSVPVLDTDAAAALEERLAEATAAASALQTDLRQAVETVEASARRRNSRHTAGAVRPVEGPRTAQAPPARHMPPPSRRTVQQIDNPARDDTGPIALRAGARRMVESLGRMWPLRLTKSQWGTVAKLKTSGGTWSTYLSEIRKYGLIDESSAGYTLTEAGFDYLGGRPDPMTATELQDHYRRILRAGAVRMLDALVDAYPNSLTTGQISDVSGIATSGGTFSTYVSDLVRNGLAERRHGELVATDILIHGADL